MSKIVAFSSPIRTPDSSGDDASYRAEADIACLPRRPIELILDESARRLGTLQYDSRIEQEALLAIVEGRHDDARLRIARLAKRNASSLTVITSGGKQHCLTVSEAGALP